MSPTEPGAGANGGSETFRILGSRLQGLRRMRGLSLSQVAQQVGMSASFIGLVERGQTDVSLSRFSRLTEFYGVQPSELMLELNGQFREPEFGSMHGGKPIDRGEGVDYRVIREEHPQLILAALAPDSRFADMRAHRGEDHWLVLEGSVTLLYGGRSYDLEQAATVRFSGSLPHGFANPNPEPALLLALCSAPYW